MQSRRTAEGCDSHSLRIDLGACLRLFMPACPLKVSSSCRIKVKLSISWLSSELMVEVAVMDWEGGDKV